MHPYTLKKRVKYNSKCLYNSDVKYKKCYNYNTVQVSSFEILSLKNIKKKLSKKYYNYLNVFNRIKINNLSLYRFYNHKLKFLNDISKFKLLKSRIYFIFDYKLEKVKKYLDKHLKKEFIILSKALFAFFILFAKKSNKRLRFCVNYRRLNIIIKRNRYLISLIDEVLIRIQGCKYLTRLNIIAAFNKLRIYLDSKKFIIFVTSLKSYKYRILLFDLINNPTSF